ncbi:MAG: PIN domain-containing protein, partial [Tetrasphaera sp.]|nr:PIN domain-containing protein [Tetrasphaera sp.]
MIYVDTSALAKLVVDEAESAALSAWLDERADEILATSILTRVELVRAATRHSAQARLAALALLGELA